MDARKRTSLAQATAKHLLSEGLIYLTEGFSDQHCLTATEAGAALADEKQWQPGAPDTPVCFTATKEGERVYYNLPPENE